MADLNPDFDLGEYARGSVLETVELSGAIGSGDVGKMLKISGVNADKQMKVAVAGATDHANYVAIKESVGAVGDLRQVLLRGDVKVLAGSAIAAGAPFTNKSGKAVSMSAGSSYTRVLGFSRAVFAADDDTGLVCFSGHG